MSIKRFLFLIALILLPFGAFYTFRKKQNASSAEPIKTEKPIRKALIQMVTASGNLKAKEQISVGSLVAGKVIDIKVEDNDVVKKDQILAILDDGVGDTETKRLTANLA